MSSSKIVVRRGMFETNSSSTHSITIEAGELNDTIGPQDDGKIHLGFGEFGWEEVDYWDAQTKAEYCHTWCWTSGGVPEGSDEGECPHPVQLAMLYKVIQEHTGCEVVTEVDVDDEWNPYGYIDHQSADVCIEAFESEENLKAFIFNSASLLHTDNDNK